MKWKSERVPARRASRGFVARLMLVLGTVISCSALSWALIASPSQALGTGTNVSAVSFSSPTIIADGASMTVATVTVTDVLNAPVPGETVAFSSSDSGQAFGSVADNNGTYSVSVTSSTTVGTPTITATDTSAPLQPSGQGTLTQTVGPAASVGVTLSPTSIVADRTSTSTATATVTDAQGRRLPADTVSFGSSDPGQVVSATTNTGNGTYAAAVTSSTTIGTPTITATDGSASGTATLTQTVGPAFNVAVSVAPTSIPADGTSTSTATAIVTDAQGRRLPAETAVSFGSSDSGQVVSATTNNGNGTYKATIRSSTNVGPATITATDGSLSGQKTLTQTAGPAGRVVVTLSPGAITANGSSTSTATAAVTDAQGHPLPAETISFSSSDPNEHVGATTNNGTGIYTATITSSTTVGAATITATDGSASGTATLTQTAGPAGRVVVTLSPGAITANGSSTSTATAAVTDAQGHPLPAETISFSSSDPNEHVGATTSNGTGIYTATITSSTTIGFVAITATDTSVTPKASGQALLGQAANSSATALTVVANAPVTNQGVTLIATVTSSSSAVAPKGALTFEDNGHPISGCGLIPVATFGQSATVTCPTSFSAQTSPAQLTAVFTSSSGSAVADSTSASHGLLVGQGGTSISLVVARSVIKVGSPVTYRATVTDSLAGPFQPSGSVQFLDHGKLIAPCANQALVLVQGLLTAQCRVQYPKRGSHTITARYSGDGGFAASLSSQHSIDVRPIRPLGRIVAKTDWQFVYALHVTRITIMRVLGARAGTTVLILCRGGGCPSPLRLIQVDARRVCRHGRCRTEIKRSLDLAPTLSTYRLRPRTVLTIELMRRYWTGKAYVFTIRPGRGPRQSIRCLAPGSTRPVRCPAH